LEPGLLVRSLFTHEGPARSLVHRLKYEGLEVAADLWAVPLTDLLPAQAEALVPVPRRLPRRLRYGIDPARVLARRMAERAGLPLVEALAVGWWGPPHAGASRRERTAPIFSLRVAPPPRCVLVDDVLTTGSTLRAAATATRGRTPWAVTLTAVEVVTSVQTSGTGSPPIQG
jgi:predicted amidophosphoribosyltransferase